MNPLHYTHAKILLLLLAFCSFLVSTNVSANIASSILPVSRSVQVGQTATVFASIVNGGSITAQSCNITPITSLTSTFSYQTTDAMNSLTGSPNTPIDIPAGGIQNFIISFTPTAAFVPTNVFLNFTCINTSPAANTLGLNTLLLSADNSPVPDIVGLTTVVDLQSPLGMSTLFAVGSSNVGATGDITVSVDDGGQGLPLALNICQTNMLGACSSAIGPTVTFNYTGGSTASFAVFVQAIGGIQFDPANNRIFIRFADSGGTARGATSTAVQSAAPSNPIVYIATQNNANQADLYLADADNPGVSFKLNPTLPVGADIEDFALSPDNSRVVYIADQDVVGQEEIYSVELKNPGVATQLNPPLVAGGDVDEFAFSPDGSKLTYNADQEVDNILELYLVDFATIGVTTKLNPPLIAGGDVVTGGVFSPDGTKVIYLDDQGSLPIELFLVDLSTPGISTKVNTTFPSFTNIASGAAFSPDGNWVIYGADQDTDTVRELYVVAVNTLGVSLKVNSNFTNNFTDVCDWDFTPDSTMIAYCADDDIDGSLELYIVNVSALGASTKLNPPLIAGRTVYGGSFRISPDSSFITYRADQDVDDVDELYRVNINAPGMTTKLNSPLVLNGDVVTSDIRSDGLAILYQADQNIDGDFELFEVAFSNPGVSTRVHPVLFGGDTGFFEYSEDGTSIIFTAEQNSFEDDLFSVDTSLLGTSTQINPTLVPGGEVFDFAIPQ